MFLPPIQKQNKTADQDNDHAQQLGNPNIGVPEIETVCSQPLNPGAAESVPEKIQQNTLSVIPPFPAAGKYDKCSQADQIPETLIQESRMDENGGSFRGCQTHPTENRSLCTEGFAIKEVSPSPDRLPDEQTEGDQIQHGWEADVPNPTENEYGQKA